jgi:hypothetical protein
VYIITQTLSVGYRAGLGAEGRGEGWRFCNCHRFLFSQILMVIHQQNFKNKYSKTITAEKRI